MSKLIRKEQCPKCAAEGKDKHGDNLAVYDDGMKYCFARHKVVEVPVKTSMDRMWRIISDSEYTSWKYGSEKKEQPAAPKSEVDTSEGGKHHINFSAQVPKLPDDFTKVMPKKAYEYLVNFGFSSADIIDMRAGWSEQYCRVVFPIVIDDQMRAWQGRYLGDETGPAKWWTEGNIMMLQPCVMGNKDSKLLVITEDILSAYKIGKYHNAMPLFGTAFPKAKMVQLARQFKKIVLWLDSDMIKRMGELRSQCLQYFDEAGIVATPKDPKAISYPEITEKLLRWEDKV